VGILQNLKIFGAQHNGWRLSCGVPN